MDCVAPIQDVLAVDLKCAPEWASVFWPKSCCVRLESVTPETGAPAKCIGRKGYTLEVHDLVKRFNGKCVVDHFSFSARPGQILSLLGPNGAGKSTTVKMLYGALRPDGGRVLYGMKDFATHRRQLKLCIGVCSQNDTLDYDLTVRGNLTVYGSYYDRSRRETDTRAEDLLSRFHLRDYVSSKPRILSGGLKRRLQIARALINDPDILFLDEPTTGLDPHARRELWNLLEELKSEGITILLTTHYMEEAEVLSDSVIILDQGRVMDRGEPAGLISRHFGPWALQMKETPIVTEWVAAKEMTCLRAYGQVTVFGEEERIDTLTTEFPKESIFRRPSNLEDVFIKLTGRTL